jgi:hypothetical protein
LLGRPGGSVAVWAPGVRGDRRGARACAGAPRGSSSRPVAVSGLSLSAAESSVGAARSGCTVLGREAL